MTAAPLLERPPMTPEQFEAHPNSRGHELIDGRMVRKPMGAESNFANGRMAVKLGLYAEANPEFCYFPSETGYACFPEDQRPDVRKPDGSLLRVERLPGGVLPLGNLTVRPDFVFESVSTNDNAEDLEWKLVQFIEVGVPLLLIVYARTRTARVIGAERTNRILGENDVFDGGDVLPGFSITLRDILPPPHLQRPRGRPKARR